MGRLIWDLITYTAHKIDPGTGEELLVSPAGAIYEAKYLAPSAMRGRIRSALNAMAGPAREFHHAMLRTVYFDDREHTSYFESRDGQMFKRKFRLREYLQADVGARYSLEIKMRLGDRTAKVRKLIFDPLPEGVRITTFSALIGEFERMLGHPLSLLRAESEGRLLLPDTIICYERHRYDDRRSGARYNLDTNIMCTHEGMKSIAAGASCKGTVLGHDIFEIKARDRTGLPGYLGGMGLEPSSFSKFVWGREFTLEADINS